MFGIRLGQTETFNKFEFGHLRVRAPQEPADAVSYGTLDAEVQRIHEAIAVQAQDPAKRNWSALGLVLPGRRG